MPMKQRISSGFDFLTPGAEWRSDGYDWVCLETGEVIPAEEYLDWQSTLHLSEVNRKITSESLNQNLQQMFLNCEEQLAVLRTGLKSEIPMKGDINPDIEVGETGTTPLTFGGVESIVHPIFSELGLWTPNPALADLILSVEHLVSIVRQRVMNGDNISKSKAEKVSSVIFMTTDGFLPLRDVSNRNIEYLRVKVDALLEDNRRLRRELRIIKEQGLICPSILINESWRYTMEIQQRTIKRLQARISELATELTQLRHCSNDLTKVMLPSPNSICTKDRINGCFGRSIFSSSDPAGSAKRPCESEEDLSKKEEP